ncbi:MAG: hypothetical protein ABEI75_01305, partial [Halobaculum sp.]
PTDDRYYVRCETETAGPMYYVAIPEGETLRVVAFTGERMQFDELELVVSPRPARYAQRAIARRAANNVPRLDEVGLLPDDVSEQAEALRNDYRGFALNGDRESFEATAHRTVDDRLQGVLGQVNAVEEAVLDDLHEEGASPFRAITRESTDDDVYTTDRICPICEERVVFVKQYRSWTGNEVRLRGACSKDGLVFEVPAEGRNTDPIHPYVETDLSWDGDRWQPLEMSFENPTDEPVRATFEPIALHNDGETLFDPLRTTRQLAPGESETVEFAVDTDRLEHNEYFVMGTVAANLDIYVGYHLARLGNRSGYVPPHIR